VRVILREKTMTSKAVKWIYGYDDELMVAAPLEVKEDENYEQGCEVACL